MRHLHLFLTLVALLFALPTLTLTAQETPAGWPVETRCVGEPTTLPEGWTFEGLIFIKSYDGIRALNPAFDTPYFVIFDNDFISGASPSPDGKWYAVPDGSTSYATDTNFIDLYYDIQRIRLYSTDGTRTLREFPWDMLHRSIKDDLEPIQWYDEQHLIYDRGHHYAGYEPYLLDIETGKIEVFNESYLKIPQGIGGLYNDQIFLSPDITRVVFVPWPTDSGIPSLYNIELSTFVEGFPDRQILPFGSVAWLPDSSAFFAETNGNIWDNKLPQIRSFSRDGVFIDSIADGRRLVLSSKATYLSFWGKSSLYLVNLAEKRIVDTCLSSYSTWSPDDKQIALVDKNGVSIFDLQSWQRYRLPYHIEGRQVSSIIWREN